METSTVTRRLRGFPVEAALVGAGLFALLAWFVGADPVRGITFSGAPFSDEGFNIVNARNFVQLGRWSTDDWNLYLVNLPFSVTIAGAFELLGVGIIQARLAMIACVSLTAAALVWSLRDVVGRLGALLAGLTFACSGLVLFYGRLAYLEDLVGLALTLGVLVLARDSRLGWRSGVWAGLCFAVAIGTKPNAAFPALGILLALAVARGWQNPALRRWLAGSALTIALAGLTWVIAIWLPNQKAVAIDVQIWGVYGFTLAPVRLVLLIGSYGAGYNDNLYSFLLAPALALAGAGTVSIAALRRRLTSAQARLAIAAFGWAAFGFGTLMIEDHRPNRYVVPLVPALAILATVGLYVAAQWLRERAATATATDGTAATDGTVAHGQQRRRWNPRLTGPVLTAFVFVAATAPGLAWYAVWAHGATYDLPAVQDQFARVTPDNVVVAGPDAAIFELKSKATTVIFGSVAGPANDGDLYAQGVRWYLVATNAAAPRGVPGDVWAARQQVACATYGGATQCLYHLP